MGQSSRRSRVVVMVGACVVAFGVAAAPGGPAAGAEAGGEWPFARQDQTNTGFQPRSGRIIAPEVKDQRYLGGATSGTSLIDLDGDGGKELLSIEAGVLIARNPDLSTEWTNATAGGITSIVGTHDLDADGVAELLVISELGYGIDALRPADGTSLWHAEYDGALSLGRIGVGKLHAGLAGLQVAVTPDRATHVTAYAFDQGVANGRQIWTSPDLASPSPSNYTASLVVSDLNVDGNADVAIATFGLIETYDGRTGALLTTANGGWNGRLEYTAGPDVNGRNYGPFKAVPQPGSPYPLLVIAATGVTMHIQVVNNGATGLSLRYDKFIKFIYDGDPTQKAVQAVESAIGTDLTGAGRPQLALSIYNDTGDERWHLLVVDLLNGFAAPIADIPGGFLRNAQDLDGDGTTELLVTQEAALAPGGGGPAEIYAAQPDGTFAKTWTQAGATFWAVRGDISGNGRSAFFVNLGADIVGYEYVDGVATQVWSHPRAQLLQVADLESNGSVEVILAEPDGSLLLKDAETNATIEETTLGGLAGQPTVATLAPGSGPSVVVPRPEAAASGATPAGRTHVFAWDSAAGGLVERWNVPAVGLVPQGAGRLSRDVAKAENSVPLFDIDGDGDGDKEMLVTDRVSGQTRVRLLASDGSQVWSHTFAAPDGLGMAYMWVVGDFRPGGTKDIFLSGLKGGYDTDMSFVLDGASGNVLWKLERGDVRGFGPCCGYAAVAKLDGSGLDQIVLQAKDLLWVMHYVGGSELFHTDLVGTVSNPVEGTRALYQTPTVVDIDADGDKDWLGTGGYLGMFRQNLAVDSAGHYSSSPAWFVATPPWDLYEVRSAVVDATGDGVADIGVLHRDGTFESINAVTGATQWSEDMGTRARGIAAADIDGDGDVEYVVGTSDGRIVALAGGVGEARRTLWTLPVGGPVAGLAIADVDGDGYSDIVATVGDGYVYVIGRRGRIPPRHR